MKTKYKYLEFVKEDSYWVVWNHVTDEHLGHVEYYKKWHQWESYLREGVGFTTGCHKDMSHFLDQLNREGKPSDEKA